MVFPTHHYEKIIETLGGDPAQLPDRCECTMVDEIIRLIDGGIEGGGGGGGFVVTGTYDADYNLSIDKTLDEIYNASLTGSVVLIANGDVVSHYQLVSAEKDYEAVFVQPKVLTGGGVGIAGFNSVHVSSDNTVTTKDHYFASSVFES